MKGKTKGASEGDLSGRKCGWLMGMVDDFFFAGSKNHQGSQSRWVDYS